MDRMKQCEFIRVGRLLATLMVTLPAVAHPSQAEEPAEADLRTDGNT